MGWNGFQYGYGYDPLRGVQAGIVANEYAKRQPFQLAPGLGGAMDAMADFNLANAANARRSGRTRAAYELTADHNALERERNQQNYDLGTQQNLAKLALLKMLTGMGSFGGFGGVGAGGPGGFSGPGGQAAMLSYAGLGNGQPADHVAVGGMMDPLKRGITAPYRPGGARITLDPARPGYAN